MYAKQSVRQPNGNDSIGIEVYRGKYRFNLSRKLSRQIFGVEQKRISTGRSVDKDNLVHIEGKASQMHLDILANNFDISLLRYGLAEDKDRVKLAIVPDKPVIVAYDLAKLWDRFSDYRENEIASTTFINEYKNRMGSVLRNLPTLDLNHALEIRQWLLSNRSLHSAKQALARLSMCCHWATKNGLILKDPFQGMATEIKAKRTNDDSLTDWDNEEGGDYRAFSLEERDNIIAFFYEHKKVAHYGHIVKFLFLTGARLGEMAGLRWGDVSPDCSFIMFKRTYDIRSKQFKGYTKTGVERKFPCSKILKELLVSIKPTEVLPDSLVFSSRDGKVFSAHSFFTVWHGLPRRKIPGVLPRLLAEGKISTYLKPYSTRHSFITHQISDPVCPIPIDVVAKWVGNSAKVIQAHYLDHRDDDYTPN